MDIGAEWKAEDLRKPRLMIAICLSDKKQLSRIFRKRLPVGMKMTAPITSAEICRALIFQIIEMAGKESGYTAMSRQPDCINLHQLFILPDTRVKVLGKRIDIHH